jgi:hypothetical protein
MERAYIVVDEQRLKREPEYTAGAAGMYAEACQTDDEKPVDGGHTTYGAVDNEDTESSNLKQHLQEAVLSGGWEGSDLGKHIYHVQLMRADNFFLDAVDAEELYGGDDFVADEVSSPHNLEASTASTGEAEESPLTEFSDDFSTCAELQAAVDGAEDWKLDEGESDWAEIHCECRPQIHQF